MPFFLYVRAGGGQPLSVVGDSAADALSAAEGLFGRGGRLVPADLSPATLAQVAGPLEERGAKMAWDPSADPNGD
ncbi:hypothetical protein A3D42_01900 [Candidatus Nomurabacteria bacterium RIFCSPHIGHO2_02_FULL_41_18]|uniref:Uncharacterized protein n=1 Tax=Candidatus Nomurabacteria bacterium RIFCSPHIGHO2_02_FULL_41_18 TaxID=1801754 RepID=A0A1F6W5T2_9BACT|nr:MAG: hypothetical protein A3D42_01900 [Candidatus Nomurabacteria bacterium RIFCSPHIGHO2_02_FULL_41_18]